MPTCTTEELLDVMRTRRSVRRFCPDPVPREAIDQLVEAAALAPTAGNRQAFRLMMITSAAIRRRMAEAVQGEIDRLRRSNAYPDHAQRAERYLQNFTHFAEAPLVIAAIHRTNGPLLEAMLQRTTARSTNGDADALASVSGAIMNLLLCAHTLGLGACWMTGPLIAAEALATLLDVPAGWALSALIPVGVPAHVPAAPKRRSPAQLVRVIADDGSPSSEAPPHEGAP